MRLDAASTRHTRLLFCTTGILLRRLASDAQLSAVSHVIVDEVRSGTGPALADGAQFTAGQMELLQTTLQTSFSICWQLSPGPGQQLLQDSHLKGLHTYELLHCHILISAPVWAQNHCVLQVHERTLQGDFLMALLKDILVARRAAGRPLKVQHCFVTRSASLSCLCIWLLHWSWVAADFPAALSPMTVPRKLTLCPVCSP